VDFSGSGYGPVPDPYEHSNETSVSRKDKEKIMAGRGTLDF
jgi:hypothetical protein